MHHESLALPTEQTQNASTLQDTRYKQPTQYVRISSSKKAKVSQECSPKIFK
ncbi:20810_t:CDS:1, partial [Gigaspora margarita]